MVKIGKYAIHGSYGICNCSITLIIFPMAFQFPTFPIQWPYMTSVPCAFKEIMHILSQRVDIFQQTSGTHQLFYGWTKLMTCLWVIVQDHLTQNKLEEKGTNNQKLRNVWCFFSTCFRKNANSPTKKNKTYRKTYFLIRQWVMHDDLNEQINT